MDESGHDHKGLPYEVRGGMALEIGAVWPFIQAMHRTEIDVFGDVLHRYGKEIKGHKLFDKDRFRWAMQGSWMENDARRKACLAFLNRGLKKESPRRDEFTAYGQACLTMVREIFRLLHEYNAVVFAVAIPRGSARPDLPRCENCLRKDHIFLFERYFDFLAASNARGLLVMDETTKVEDRRFTQRITHYFERAADGVGCASRIVPVPLFVSSDMYYPIQAADCVVYCINWGFRLPGMNGPERREIAEESAGWLYRLQARMPDERNGGSSTKFGIVYVPRPYTDGCV